jgi:prophage regulatory protein
MSQEISRSLRLLRRPQVQARVGIGRTTIYAMVNDGTFPAPVQLGARAVAWRESEIDAWIASRTPTRSAGVTA